MDSSSIPTSPQQLIELLQMTGLPDKAAIDKATAALNSAVLNQGSLQLMIDTILNNSECPTDAKIRCAILLKNQLGKSSFETKTEGDFRAAQDFALQAFVQSRNYIDWVYSTDASLRSKVCDQISILIGKIVKAKIIKQAEGVDDEFPIANELIKTLINAIAGSAGPTEEQAKIIEYEGLRIKHIKIVVENAASSDFGEMFTAHDFGWLIPKISEMPPIANLITSGEKLAVLALKLKIRQFKLLQILLDNVRKEELAVYAQLVEAQLLNIIEGCPATFGVNWMNASSNEDVIKQVLRFLNYLASLLISVNYSVSDEAPAGERIKKMTICAKHFFSIGFDEVAFSDSTKLGWLVQTAYINNEDKLDEKLSAVSEEILQNCLSYFKNVLNDPDIWMEDMAAFDPISGGEGASSEIEDFLNNEVFNQAQVAKFLQALQARYLALSQKEIELWKADSLDFYMSQKEESNSVKGIFLREKASEFIASIFLRYATIVEAYSKELITDLSSNRGDGSLQAEIARETKYQILRVWLKSDSEEDQSALETIFTLITSDLEGPSLIVKARAVQILSILADSQVLSSNPDIQEKFVRGVINLYKSQEGSVDVHLQMCCIDYFKNFYNDHKFKIIRFAPLLPNILEICNNMVMKFSSDQTTGEAEVKYRAMNEILELYRFIVEKYSGYNQLQPDGSFAPITDLSQLAVFLNTYWTKYTQDYEGGDDQTASQREQTLILSSIMRIMSQVIARLPLKYTPEASVQQILSIVFTQATQALTFSKVNCFLSEFCFTYLGCLARFLQQFKITVPTFQLPQAEQQILQNSLKFLLANKEHYDDSPSSLVILDLALACLQHDQNLFFTDIVRSDGSPLEAYLTSIKVEADNFYKLKDSVNLLKSMIILSNDEAVATLLGTALAEFIRRVLSTPNSEIEPEEALDHLVCPAISILVTKSAALETQVQQVLSVVSEQIPDFVSHLKQLQSSSETEGCIEMTLGLCFSNPFLREKISKALEAMPQEKRFEVMDSLSISRDIIKTFIQVNIENNLESSSALTTSHLLKSQANTEEEVFFELLNAATDEDMGEGQGNINVSSTASKKLLSERPEVIEREREVFKIIAQNLEG